ncbi:MAG TPA: R3H domain-containing nucleic acid-binding protein [Candidatus Acidoferrales bacterium]|nr:R3H domain-containing nucleic acid-binding protein [Candidatus Acidoferrales bacterium]
MGKPYIIDGKTNREAVAAELTRFLGEVLKHARLDLSFSVRMEAEAAPSAGGDKLEDPEMVVDFRGRDQDLLLERNAELLKALEYLALRVLRFEPQFHERLRFDCGDYRALRLEELKLAAKVAAERVQESRQPFRLNPMSSRERRVVHLVLKEISGVRTASEGMGDDRRVVIFPADKK